MTLIENGSKFVKSNGVPGAGGTKGNLFVMLFAALPEMSWNGFAKLGCPPTSAAPADERPNGGAPRFCSDPSSSVRLKYKPQPARIESLFPPSPDRKPRFGAYTKPTRGPMCPQLVSYPPARLHVGSPG